jgi:hypothetical protein
MLHKTVSSYARPGPSSSVQGNQPSNVQARSASESGLRLRVQKLDVGRLAEPVDFLAAGLRAAGLAATADFLAAGLRAAGLAATADFLAAGLRAAGFFAEGFAGVVFLAPGLAAALGVAAVAD